MSGVLAVRVAPVDLTSNLIETAVSWNDGRVAVGADREIGRNRQELRIFRHKPGKLCRVGVLRICMEPVIVMDTACTGALARVHKFRYQDAAGGGWWMSWCGGCGHQFHRPEAGMPPMDQGCSLCGADRSAVECEAWHEFGECPYCPRPGDAGLRESEAIIVGDPERWTGGKVARRDAEPMRVVDLERGREGRGAEVTAGGGRTVRCTNSGVVEVAGEGLRA